MARRATPDREGNLPREAPRSCGAPACLAGCCDQLGLWMGGALWCARSVACSFIKHADHSVRAWRAELNAPAARVRAPGAAHSLEDGFLIPWATCWLQPKRP